jgi:chromobox protein 5
MPREATSESESAAPPKSYGKKARASAGKSSKQKSPEPEVPESDHVTEGVEGEDEQGEEGRSEEEEEYEIEAILDDCLGKFPDGRSGYFVKWKGYPPSENSWVDEQDAPNAHGLIEAYWKKKRHETKGKGGRKSTVQEDTSAKKRGRGRTAEQSDDAEEIQVEAPVKKPRKSTGSATKAKTTPAKTPAKPANKVAAPNSDDEAMDIDDDPLVSMEKHMHNPNWERMIKSVQTVERTADDRLAVYFLLKNGGRAMQYSDVCKKKFPLKLIEFYESNLRWKSTDVEADSV